MDLCFLVSVDYRHVISLSSSQTIIVHKKQIQNRDWTDGDGCERESRETYVLRPFCKALEKQRTTGAIQTTKDLHDTAQSTWWWWVVQRYHLTTQPASRLENNTSSSKKKGHLLSAPIFENYCTLKTSLAYFSQDE
jgi:hypothetical protein